MTAKSARQPGVTASAVLARLERMVRTAEGYRLALVRCDDPVRRDQLCAALLQRLRGKRVLEVRLESRVRSLFHALAPRAYPAAPPNAVLVTGFEQSLLEGEEAAALLEVERERLEQAIPTALIMWLPEPALRRIEEAAPSFWNTRGVVYEFPDGPAHLAEGTAAGAAAAGLQVPAAAAAGANGGAGTAPSTPWPGAEAPDSEEEEAAAQGVVGADEASAPEAEPVAPSVEELRRAVPSVPELPALGGVNLAEKKALVDARMKLLLQVVQEFAEEDPDARDASARLLEQLGLLHASMGEWETAADRFEEEIEIRQRLEQECEGRVATAGPLLHLGIARQHQGRQEEAARLYRQGLELAEAAGDQGVLAAALHHSAALEQARGNLDEAERLLERSRAAWEAAGDREGLAGSLHQLGAIRQRRRDLAGAQRLYEESLHIRRDLDDRSGIAATLHQLGTVRHQEGDLAAALPLYEESLRLKKVLGDRSGVAVTLGQIGRVEQQQGRLREALQNYTTAYLVFRSLDSPYAALARQLISGVRLRAGEVQFEEWLAGPLRSVARQVREALAAEEPGDGPEEDRAA